MVHRQLSAGQQTDSVDLVIYGRCAAVSPGGLVRIGVPGIVAVIFCILHGKKPGGQKSTAIRIREFYGIMARRQIGEPILACCPALRSGLLHQRPPGSILLFIQLHRHPVIQGFALLTNAVVIHILPNQAPDIPAYHKALVVGLQAIVA